MAKKKINLVFLVIIIVLFILTLVGIYIIYKDNSKIEDSAREAEMIIEEKVINIVDEVNSEGLLGLLYFSDGKKVAIYDGLNEENLSKGSSMLSNGAVLNKSGSVILFGHRDTAFRPLWDIEVDDMITIKTDVMIKYKVISMEVMEVNDKRIYADDELTLVTCYPLVYSGPSVQRYVIKLKRINT